MPFAAAISSVDDTPQALDEVCGRALEQLGGKPDLAVLFFSPHHLPAAKTIAKTAHQRLRASCLFGCNGEAIIGNDLEVENEPALSLWLGRWNKAVSLDRFTSFSVRLPKDTACSA